MQRFKALSLELLLPDERKALQGHLARFIQDKVCVDCCLLGSGAACTRAEGCGLHAYLIMCGIAAGVTLLAVAGCAQGGHRLNHIGAGSMAAGLCNQGADSAQVPRRV